MFDIEGLDPDDLGEATEAQLVAAISAWTQEEAAAAARRLAAIAELAGRRCYDAPLRSKWACDDWDAVAAQVGAAMGVGHRKASSQMYLAQALRERLPKVAALFAGGQLSASLVATIAWRTALIQDNKALRRVDAELANAAVNYGTLSLYKTAEAIDAVVETHDSAALRRGRQLARSRDVIVNDRDADGATTTLWGRLYSHDAVALHRRLMAMAHGVCDDDPRTIGQRRADALGALATGAETLVCGCGNADCPASTGETRPAGTAVIHVVANAESMTASVDRHRNGERPPAPPIDRRDIFAVPAPTPEPDPPAKVPPALVLGGPVLPASLLAELIAAGARIKPIRHPGPESKPELTYRPSAALADFVRCRDMTCRWPNCHRPAEFCDLDHATAYGGGGLTHPSNLRCLCRKHHLIKTFHGWRDRQHPDGTIEWISPDGATYTTQPGSLLLFPSLCEPTGTLSVPTARPPDSPGRTLMMPTRRRTRTQNRARAIAAERALNTTSNTAAPP
ncbi:hypothetical protein BHQ15_06045 [Mycolicibacillus koreensis]|nr:hypothetical protein BHQ15_06045 [Mycolicibacillus koreensis]